MLGYGCRSDISIADDRDRDARIVLNLANQRPVGLTIIHLATCSSVNGESCNAAVLKLFGKSGDDLMLAVPSEASLDCNWDIDCLDHLTGDVEQQRHILQHSSSSALACHLLDRTPEVDVDDVRTSLLDNLGSLNHTLHITSIYLNHHRTFLLKNLELTHRTVDVADERIGRNELGIHHVGTELFALKTEANIGHVFHWRKKHCAVGKSNICYFHSAKIRNFTHI